VRVLDIADQHYLYLIQELAQRSLEDAMRKGDVTPADLAEVEANITCALRAIHDAGRVYCDFARTTSCKSTSVETRRPRAVVEAARSAVATKSQGLRAVGCHGGDPRTP